MATRIPVSFFDAKEIAFVGYSNRHAAYCAEIRTAFESRGSRVYPVNPGSGPYDVETHKSVSDIPGTPELAVVITNKTRNAELLERLAKKGVKRVIFGSKVSADAAVLERCAALGMEGVVACPLMALGSGFHRFHGWLAGVPKLTPAAARR
ncbi:MAG: CoA-binding protein [Spirochaetes bacterium]|nr:CoA-binding protein [Spirochaetota bacterium]